MLKKPITFEDWNGVTRTLDYYFHLSKPEVVNMQQSVEGGYDAQLKSIAAGANGAAIMNFFENLIRKSYGRKTPDGLRFEKSDEISREFMESPAYEVLFEELVTDAKAAAAFVNAIMPKDTSANDNAPKNLAPAAE